MRVLVTAASEHGSTGAIAQAIGEVLRSAGHDVRVLPPDEAGALADLDAVVLGSAVYAGHWLEPATALATRVATELPGRPVWLFSSGPVGKPGGKLARQMGEDPAEVAAVFQATHAREHKMFAGKLERGELHGLQRAALWIVRGLEGDFRDWQEIRGWAQSIAAQLSEATAA